MDEGFVMCWMAMRIVFIFPSGELRGFCLLDVQSIGEWASSDGFGQHSDRSLMDYGLS